MMYSLWRQNDLPELAVDLASRPGHEAVHTQIAEILRHGFGAGYEAFSHEVRLPEMNSGPVWLSGHRQVSKPTHYEVPVWKLTYQDNLARSAEAND